MEPHSMNDQSNDKNSRNFDNLERWVQENPHPTDPGSRVQMYRGDFRQVMEALEASARPSPAAPNDLLLEAAEIAGRCWHAFSQTKQAHERQSPEPFRPTDFGLSYDKAVYSRDCMEQIRALAARSPLATISERDAGIPQGWRIEKDGDAIILHSAGSLTYVVHADDGDTTAHEALHALVDALLNERRKVTGKDHQAQAGS